MRFNSVLVSAPCIPELITSISNSKFFSFKNCCRYPGIVVSSEVAPAPNIVDPPTMNILYVFGGFISENSGPRNPSVLIVIELVF